MTREASAAIPRPNLAAVAALAGVSASTASLAFSGAGPVSATTRARVLAAAETLNYAGPDPRAQSLRRGRSGIVGVVIEDRLSDAFRDPMNIAMLDGIADETGRAGAGLLLLTESGSDRTTIASAPIDGVILVGCSTSLEESVAVVRQRGIPIVAIEARDLDGALAIGLDNREASATAARHLKQLEHDRIAVVTLPLDRSRRTGELLDGWEQTTTSYTALERLLGVADVYGRFDGYVATGSTIDAGRVAARHLLGEERSGTVVARSASERPTAVIAQSDLLAVGVLRAAEELGIAVPAELSVIGFDGARIDEARPYDLATFIQPAVEKGQAAGRAVLELIDGGDPTGVDFVSEFHEGNTTAHAPAAARRRR